MTTKHSLFIGALFIFTAVLFFSEFNGTPRSTSTLANELFLGSAFFFLLGCGLMFVGSVILRLPEYIRRNSRFCSLLSLLGRERLSRTKLSEFPHNFSRSAFDRSSIWTSKRVAFIFTTFVLALLFLSRDVLSLIGDENQRGHLMEWSGKARTLAFCAGYTLMLIGSLLFNFPDYVKYGWPLSKLIRWYGNARACLVPYFKPTRSSPPSSALREDCAQSLIEGQVARPNEVHISSRSDVPEDSIFARVQYPKWPAADMETIGSLPPYAVIIPCHNYGHFLANALDSVLSQQPSPAEVVVVLDDCSDDSENVAARYASLGVRTITVHCRDTYLTRRAGFNATVAPFVCMLDADDMLGQGYFAAGLPCFRDPKVGIVTGWVQEFGRLQDRWEPLLKDLLKDNCVSSAAIFRRSAAEGTRLFERFEGSCERTNIALEDYFQWRWLVNSGWVVALGHGTHYYRQHNQNRSLLGDYESVFITRIQNNASSAPRKVRAGFITPIVTLIGGVERHFGQLVRYARDVEWVGVVHIPETNNPVYEGQDYQGVPLFHGKTRADAIMALASTCDVIYAWGHNVAKEMKCLPLSTPILACLHTQGIYSKLAAEDFAFSGARLIAVSTAASKTAPPLAPCRVIRNGADFYDLAQGASRWQQREAWGVESHHITVGYVGRWSPEKRIQLLLESMKHLPPRVLPVICTPPDAVSDAEKLRAEHLVGRRVVWTTTQTPGAVFRGLDALVIVSQEEGGPMVALEAWACECPVVSTPIGIIPEFHQEFGEMAKVIPADPTPEEIADAVISTLNDREATLTRVLRAKEVVWRHFTTSRMVRTWENELCELVRVKRQKQKQVDKSGIDSSVAV